MRNLQSLLAGLVLAACGGTAQAAQLVSDTFESYPSGTSTQLDSAWPIQTAAGAPTGGTAMTSSIADGPAAPNTSKTLLFPANGAGNTGRRQQLFANTVPTASAPIEWSFDYYDPTGSTTQSYRQYSELYAVNEASSNALTQLIAMGANSTATAGIPTPGGTAQAFNGAKYHARVAFGTGGGWFNLQANRSVGWHNFKAVIDGSKIDFYVDGVFDTSFTNGGATTGASVGYDEIRLGSAASSQFGSGYYDNVLVQTVPEPTSVAAVGLVAVGLLTRRRRAGHA